VSRLIFLLAVIFVVYILLKSYRRQIPGQDASDKAAEEMVRCLHCGVHLPKSESVSVNGKYYCCDAHFREHVSK
jgi:uncharacterized protein